MANPKNVKDLTVTTNPDSSASQAVRGAPSHNQRPAVDHCRFCPRPGPYFDTTNYPCLNLPHIVHNLGRWAGQEVCWACEQPMLGNDPCLGHPTCRFFGHETCFLRYVDKWGHCPKCKMALRLKADSGTIGMDIEAVARRVVTEQSVDAQRDRDYTDPTAFLMPMEIQLEKKRILKNIFEASMYKNGPWNGRHAKVETMNIDSWT